MNLYYSFPLSFEAITSYLILLIIALEYIGTQLFNRTAIEAGLSVFRRSIEISNQDFKLPKGTFLETEGKFRFLSSSICIFTSRLHYFELFRFKTIFPVKGIFELNPTQIKVTGKIPVGSAVLIILILLNLYKTTSESFEFALFIVIMLTLYSVFSFYISRLRFEMMINEFKSLVKID